MKTITLKVPDELAEELDQEAAERGRTRSDLVREAIGEYLPGRGKQKRSTFGELARDLRGAVSGPPDLSTNPDYFDGFGR